MQKIYKNKKETITQNELLHQLHNTSYYIQIITVKGGWWEEENDLAKVYLLVEQTVDNEEEGALLGVENYKQDLKEEIRLVQAQNPGTAQDDKLGHDLEQNQPVKIIRIELVHKSA